ncbi:MAG: diacylglycerol kinase family protein [Nitrospirae bacterium]|nr:diacylglycerol kinase family protein [Nitrospirota bacterium]
MPLRKLLESTNYAVSGILYAAKTQRHMRYHLYAAVLVLMFSLIVGVKPYEFIAIAILVTIVISAEMLNTAVELIVYCRICNTLQACEAAILQRDGYSQAFRRRYCYYFPCCSAYHGSNHKVIL